MKVAMALFGLLLMSGCQTVHAVPDFQTDHDPWWSIDFQGPSYMQGEVEERVAEDINGKLFQRSGGGSVGGDRHFAEADAAKGWHRIGGNVMPVTGADLPKRIFVRWQSVVEPQTYKGWIDIPEKGRQLMRASISEPCPKTGRSRYGASVVVGLAPGGIMRIWVKDSCAKPIQVAQAQAEVEPLGPYQGKTNGNYFPQSKASKQYVEKYGIPYGSW